MTPRRAFIIDVDNTLLDTDRIKASWKNHFKTGFVKTYKKSKVDGNLDIKLLAKNLSCDVNYFTETNFNKFIFKNVFENLKRLKKLGRVILLSQGEKFYTKIKIKKSGLTKVIDSKNIIVTQNKKASLKKIITELKSQNFKRIFIVDDISTNLTEAAKIYPEMVCIWIRYGTYKNLLPLTRGVVAAEVADFSAAVNYIERFIDMVHPSKLSTKFSVLSGIDDREIRNILIQTKRDALIKKFTHDYERFKNLKTFKSWKGRGKNIYSLVKSDGKLAGIIWFTKKKFLNFKNTFAIRMYKPSRGLGLAKKFMKAAFNDYSPKLVWLSTNRNNIPATKLYKSFGFKEIESTKKDEVVMILK